MKKLLLLLCISAVVAMFAVPAVASAGCLASAGNPQVRNSTQMQAYTSANCTTNNGSYYQMRVYFQGNSGGSWHSVNLSNPAVYNIYNPSNGADLDYLTILSCGFYVQADTSTRTKVVLENMNSGSVDTNFSGSTALPSACY